MRGGFLRDTARTLVGRMAPVAVAASRRVKREVELWRWRRVYAQQLPPPLRDVRETIGERAALGVPRVRIRIPHQPTYANRTAQK